MLAFTDAQWQEAGRLLLDPTDGPLLRQVVPRQGPAVGALIGVGFELLLKGKPTAAGSLAAQGMLGAEGVRTEVTR